MAASRMISRLSDPSPSHAASSAVPSEGPVISSSSGQGNGAQGAVYRSVRSACGHVARHFPNLWKMGQHYLEGRFDPRNYGMRIKFQSVLLHCKFSILLWYNFNSNLGTGDKGKEELQAHPQQDKEKVSSPFRHSFNFLFFYYCISRTNCDNSWTKMQQYEYSSQTRHPQCESIVGSHVVILWSCACGASRVSTVLISFFCSFYYLSLLASYF